MIRLGTLILGHTTKMRAWLLCLVFLLFLTSGEPNNPVFLCVASLCPVSSPPRPLPKRNSETSPGGETITLARVSLPKHHHPVRDELILVT